MASSTIGLLSPGEMGSAFGGVLHGGGVRVVTWVAARSQRTQLRAQEAGLEALPSLEALVKQADLVLCIVPSSAALPMAQAVAAALQIVGRVSPPPSPSPVRGGGDQPNLPPTLRGRVGVGGNRPFVYCDLNSIGPGTAAKIAEAIEAAGGEFVDGSIIGNAGGLRGRTTVYLSGPGAERLQPMLAPLRTSVVGKEPGQASAFKVLYAGLTKGLSALGVELLAGAERLGLRDLLMAKYREQSNPAHFFEQTLPGLPSRSGRRAEEMSELAATLEELGLTAYTANAAQKTLAAVAERYVEDGALKSNVIPTSEARRNPPPGATDSSLAPRNDMETLDEFLQWWTSPLSPTLPRQGGGS